MVAGQVFRVLTEFRFEIGSAVASSDKLAGKVDQISDAADRALFSFQRLSLGIVTGFLSGPGGGILGILGAAVSSSQEFMHAQIGLANVLGRSSGTFAERMSFAEQKLASINRLAQDFALPSKDLVEITKVLTPVLRTKLPSTAAVDKSIDLGRFFLKAAPTLNVDPGLAIGQLQRAVLGFADAGDPLFRILTADTMAMNEFVGESKKFNQLTLQERIEKLTSAFKEFGSDLDVLNSVTNSISGQFRILKENLSGMFSILRPLGEVLSRPIVDGLQRLNRLLTNDLKVVMQDLAFAIEPFTRDLDSLLVTLMQLRELRKDLDLAGDIFFFTASLIGLKFVLDLLKVRLFLLTPALNGFSKFIGFFGTLRGPAKLIGPLSGITGLFNKVFIFATRLLVPLAALVAVLQFFSRVAAIVRIEFAERLAGLSTLFSRIANLFGRIAGFFLEGVDALARFVAISPVMELFFTIVEALGEAIEALGKGLATVVAGFQGVTLAVFEFFNQLKEAALFRGFESGKIAEAFEFGAQDTFEKIFGALDQGRGVSQAQVNINKVEINNDFKERIEPDRVAFTVKDQLMKAALNPVAARGRPFNPAVAR